jgi:hypothetical protein
MKHFDHKNLWEVITWRPRHKWEDNVKTNLGEIWCEVGLELTGSGPGPMVGLTGVSCKEVVTLK